MAALGLMLALLLTWTPGSKLNQPSSAYARNAAYQTPASDKPDTPPNPRRIPFKSDQLKSTQPLASPLSPGATDEIANGDFENGQDGSWEEYSFQGYDIILHKDSLPTLPLTGDWAAWLGGADSEVSYIQQVVTLPAEVTWLRFWYWIGSEDACGYDYAWVRINDTDLESLDLCVLTNTGDWMQESIDLRAYAGTTVTLKFYVETDDSLISNYLVDHVELYESLPEDYIASLPLVLKNYWVGYFDDFSDPTSGWVAGENEVYIYRYLDNEYQMYIKQANTGRGITPDLVMPGDYRVEVDARKVSTGDGSYGLIFGSRWTTDSWETYQALIRPTTGEFFVEKRTLDGAWTTIQDWTYSWAINPDDQTNHIRVDRIGATIRLYINDLLVLIATDYSFTSSGRDAGIRVYSYDDAPVDVRFDNFTATMP